MVELRPYQRDGVDFLLEKGSGLVRAGTGAGKTLIGLTAAVEGGFSRLLIVVPRYSALLAWQKALEEAGLGPITTVVEKWPGKKRAALWAMPQGWEGETQIIVCLYATLVRDADRVLQAPWEVDVVVWDESHKLKNRRAFATFNMAKKISRLRRNYFLTATPWTRGVEDLWTTLHLLAPGVWSSYWKYVARYCVTEHDGYGVKVVGANATRLRELKLKLSDYVYNISDDVVSAYVPARVRSRLIVKLESREEKIYCALEAEGFAQLGLRAGAAVDADWLMAPQRLSRTLKLRQFLTCPRMVHDALSVGPIEEVLNHARDNVEDGHFVVFSEFRGQFDIWEKWLRIEGCAVERLHGGISSDELRTRISRFENAGRAKKTPSVLLCTSAFSESFDLMTVRNAYCIGFPWDPILNYQAEGRLTRGVKKWVNFWYVVHKGKLDSSVLDVLNTKVRNTSVDVLEQRNGNDKK